MCCVSKFSCKSNRVAQMFSRLKVGLPLILFSLLLLSCSGETVAPTRPIIPDALPQITLNPPTPIIATRPGETLMTPMPVCTPPACAINEDYFCSGECPNGCGIICVTPTVGDVIKDDEQPSVTNTAVSQPPTATNTPQPPQPIQIEFAPGATGASVPGSVVQGTTQRYILRAMAGQQMNVQLTGDLADLALAVIGQGGSVFQSQMSGLTNWQGNLPATQDYYLDVVGNASRNFTLNVTVTALPAPTATIDLSPERIQFLPGTTSATRPGTLGPGQSKTLALNAATGQLMEFVLTSAAAPINITMTYPGTTLFHEGVLNQSTNQYRTTGMYTLPLTGDYAFLLTNVGTAVTEYTITYSITDNTASGTTPTRVQFLPGSTSATLSGAISQISGDQAYVLTAVSGQIMNIQLLAATTPLFVTIADANGVLLAQQSGIYRQDLEKFETALALTLPASGDYIITLALIGAAPLPTEFDITFTIQ
ncbi:MAG: hypothetical protein DWQ04_29960 [Chloroflexi bacterium]|nr:MAG: hypothetical protein DWQ04_29960 [Chloroflexota bacterium]